jgi:hypothetical protein
MTLDLESYIEKLAAELRQASDLKVWEVPMHHRTKELGVLLSCSGRYGRSRHAESVARTTNRVVGSGEPATHLYQAPDVQTATSPDVPTEITATPPDVSTETPASIFDEEQPRQRRRRENNNAA